jgi:hypothetical protein
MSRESSTEFLEKKHPIIKAALDYTLRRLETVLMMLVVTGLFSISSCRHSKLASQMEKQAQIMTNVVNYISQ